MADTSPAAVERPAYLIRKHGAYYRPNSQGYTGSAILAGRYTLADAEAITHPNGPDGPRDGMTYVHEDDLKDDDWIAYAALSAQLEAAKSDLKSVLDREAATCKRSEDRADAKIAKARAQGKAEGMREADKLSLPAHIIDALNYLPEGPWVTHTSCSYRRISRLHGADGGVLHAFKQRSDGHPDLSWTEEECNAICTIINDLRILALIPADTPAPVPLMSNRRAYQVGVAVGKASRQTEIDHKPADTPACDTKTDEPAAHDGFSDQQGVK